MRLRVMSALTVLVMAAVACGGGDAESTGTTTESPGVSDVTQTTAPATADTTAAPDTTTGEGTQELAVCPLLGPDEVGAVLESPDQGEQSALLAPLYTCTWTDSAGRELTLSVARVPSPAEADALYQGGSELEGSEDLAGLGDAARLHPDYFIDGADIEVLSGSYYIDLSITEIDDDRALVPLLELVLNRLP